jgi:hypothetical protein
MSIRLTRVESFWPWFSTKENQPLTHNSWCNGIHSNTEAKKTKSCHQQLKKQMTHISSHCHTQFLSHLQMQVTCMKLSFGLGSASYLNVMRFSKPSHIITHLFPILPRLVSNNHINNFQTPKNALFFIFSLLP